METTPLGEQRALCSFSKTIKTLEEKYFSNTRRTAQVYTITFLNTERRQNSQNIGYKSIYRSVAMATSLSRKKALYNSAAMSDVTRMNKGGGGGLHAWS